MLLYTLRGSRIERLHINQSPDRLPDLSDFLSSASPDVPDGITRRVSETFEAQVALLLLDIDGLWVHPTAIHPGPAGERDTEEGEPLGVSVPLVKLRNHTLSRAIFERRSLTLHREEWAGSVPMAGEYLATVPMKMADEMVGVLSVASDEQFAEETVRALEYVAAQAGAALGIAERYSDSVWRARRRIKPSLAAQVQHDLLPPQEQYTERLSMAGRIEPAYDIGGD
jgi:GAF domain-containing protein